MNFTEQITAKTLKDRACWGQDQVNSAYKTLLNSGYENYNHGDKFRPIKGDIEDVNWKHWFDLAENSDCEFGGVMLYDNKLNVLINPVISLGCQNFVHLPDADKLITIHSHPSKIDEPLENLKPSLSDWLHGSGMGWQIVVTRWGLFVHYAKKARHSELYGKVKHFPTDGSHEKYKLYFIPRTDPCLHLR